MKRSRFSEEQIIGILKEHQAGLSAQDLCRKHGSQSMAGWIFLMPPAEGIGGGEPEAEEAVG